MNTCCWIINNVDCTNSTEGLVCDSCLPEKQQLYNAYKHTEKKAINAISSNNVRGDVYEVLKVINRIKAAISLRKKFTNRLQIHARDYGHELRICNLFQKVRHYQEYLQLLWTQSIEEEVIVEEIEKREAMTSVTHNDCLTQVQEVVNSIVEDPFGMFEDDIKSYKEFHAYATTLWESLQKVLNFTDLQMRYMYNYLLQINKHVVNCYSSIGLLIKGSHFVLVAPSTYRRTDYLPETVIRIFEMLSEGFPTFSRGLAYMKMVIPDIIEVNKYKLTAKITNVEGKSKLVIHHYIGCSSDVGLVVEWVGKNRYKYRVVKVDKL